MILSDYIQTPQADCSGETKKNIGVAEGYYINEKERLTFVSENFQEASVRQLFKQRTLLYGTIGFPLAGVNEVLGTNNDINFLYVIFKSPLHLNFLIYDEYVYKNFPHAVKLLKQMRDGGTLFIVKKPNEDVLFVKICNIYEGEDTLKMELV